MILPACPKVNLLIKKFVPYKTEKPLAPVVSRLCGCESVISIEGKDSNSFPTPI
jgi:hypothetical protein